MVGSSESVKTGVASYLFANTYRDWGDFSVEHLVVLIGLLSLLLLLYSVVRNKRSVALDKAREAIAIPKSIISEKQLPRKVYAAIISEIQNETEIVENLVPMNGRRGDPGWAGKVHFNTSIAKSYLVIEDAVLVARPGLRLANFRTVRDYVDMLRKEFPGIKEETAEFYTTCYEQARFGNQRFNEEQYGRFMQAVWEIIEKIQ